MATEASEHRNIWIFPNSVAKCWKVCLIVLKIIVNYISSVWDMRYVLELSVLKIDNFLVVVKNQLWETRLPRDKTKHSREISLDIEQYLTNVSPLLSHLPGQFQNHKIFHGIISECTDPALHRIMITIPLLTWLKIMLQLLKVTPTD